MTEIHVFPVQSNGPGQIDRLIADLSVAVAKKQELGPLAPHIQATGQRLLHLCRELEAAIDDLDRSLIAHSSKDLAAFDGLRQFISWSAPCLSGQAAGRV